MSHKNSRSTATAVVFARKDARSADQRRADTCAQVETGYLGGGPGPPPSTAFQVGREGRAGGRLLSLALGKTVRELRLHVESRTFPEWESGAGPGREGLSGRGGGGEWRRAPSRPPGQSSGTREARPGGARAGSRPRGGESSRRPSGRSVTRGAAGGGRRERAQASLSTRRAQVDSAPPGPARPRPSRSSGALLPSLRRERSGAGKLAPAPLRGVATRSAPTCPSRASEGWGFGSKRGKLGVRGCAGAVAGRRTLCFQNGGSDGCGYPERHQQRRGKETL